MCEEEDFGLPDLLQKINSRREISSLFDSKNGAKVKHRKSQFLTSLGY